MGQDWESLRAALYPFRHNYWPKRCIPRGALLQLTFFVIDTAFYIEPKEPIELRWAYYELLRQDIDSTDSGSAIPSTSREDFYRLPVLAPPFDIQQRFVELLTPFWTWQEQNEKEPRTLAAIRDALLPKLISGELRVKDAEQFVAAGRV
jgi:type I restriction enzyme, S subunit